MHIAFLSNPASGELNVQLTTAEQLVAQGHAVTFLSAESCRTKINRFRQAQKHCHRDSIQFISLGSGHTVDDVTPFIQERMHLMRRVPGDPVSLQTCIECALGPAEEHAATAIRVRDHLNALDPDMICVDALSPSCVTGTRLTKRKFILTIPCSPGLSALPGAFDPHVVAWNRRGSWGTFFENLYLSLSESIHSRTHRDRREKHKIIKKLGLRSYGANRDSAHFPPHWSDDHCVAGIHFNTPGMIDCPRQSSKFVFVGAGVSEDPELPATTFPELEWMDEAAYMGHDVVYINMGSMFIWESDEFEACVAGFKAAYRNLGGRVRFLVKINGRPRSRSRGRIRHDSTATPGSEQKKVEFDDMAQLPPYIRLTSWIQNQQSVYTHPALKAFAHHGGGNSFNEAVHFAIPQLVLSQWLDTHEYGLYAERFGLGLRSARPPRIEADDIRLKIETLLGPKWDEYKRNCRAWAFRSQMAGGPAAAAKIVLFHAENEMRDPGKRVSEASDSGLGSELELTPPLSPVLEAKEEGEVKEIMIYS
ncbi:glycosyltransferase [Aspergillus mulundensis]|uniref:Erythromycin biosynthesis protein CIII-like C-terminal domain-containing protein n=1 Tax=Aspergillus mulundensis TaxID=1810919 RepID=A0A3D8T387_9EURO|nr:Uncharacterized protein DSM5745_00338 [Aspergillus mulundensis]RDW93016.1 Uncharacterized protein DSM5745_00338 [Aspergillus mulundensis]